MEAWLSQLRALLEPFKTLDPAGWFKFAGVLDAKSAIPVLIVGAVFALIGSRTHIFRAVAALMGLMQGVLFAPLLVQLMATELAVKLPSGTVALALPCLLGLLGALVPASVFFTLVGVVGGIAGLHIVEEHAMLVGVGPGFFLAGVVGVIAERPLSVLCSALLGGWMATCAMLALGAGNPVGKLLGSGPSAPLLAAVLIAIAGAALQFTLSPNEELRRQIAEQKRRKKELDREAKARDKRFADYGGKKKG